MEAPIDDFEPALREKFDAVKRVAEFKPRLAIGIIVLGILAAVLEGIGLSFIFPIIQIQQSSTPDPDEADGLHAVFVSAFETIGLPFTLEYVILGVAIVITVRFTTAFIVAWLYRIVKADYIRHLQVAGFERAVDARISYFDEQGSEEVLNTIVTEARNSGQVITWLARIFQEGALVAMYFAITLYLAPILTIFAVVVLGGITYLVRFVIEPGWAVGDRIAEANERLQTIVQAGTMGIRDVKLFGMQPEILDDFYGAVNQLRNSRVKVGRNKAFIGQFYQLLAALTIFALVYLAFTFSTLSLASLGMFFVAMFRLAPRMSTLNNMVYKAESDLPHLVRTHQFLDKLEANQKVDTGTGTAPDPIEEVAFEHVSFAYAGDERVLEDLDFSVERGEFIAFAGPSGAGKSTIVSLLTRMYEPSRGSITANATPIEEFDLGSWREQVAIVRQAPYMFNESLEFNLTIGNRAATEEKIRNICRVARVDEFLENLPEGLDTTIGEGGVRLSGGQRQRVAIARALLKDADIIILDEATSDLDATLEREVHQALETLDRDSIVIVIAHRLSTITNADRIYTIKDGRIAEVGPHEELLKKDGQYAQLYALQSSV